MLDAIYIRYEMASVNNRNHSDGDCGNCILEEKLTLL